jgi:hypothetical protein
MAADEKITCPICGFKNPAEQERCHSCGAKIEALTATYTPEEQLARRYQQEDFVWKWALLAGATLTALHGLFLGLLPSVLPTYDPQGLPGLMLSVLISFVGGIGLGLLSPGKTFVEPAAGAMLAAIPMLSIIAARTPDGLEPSLLAYVVCAVMGVMTALFGAFVGEKLQMTAQKSQPKAR